jgi:serpin B
MDSPWKIPFDESQTYNDVFYLEGGSTVEVEMMHNQDAQPNHAYVGNIELVELDYQGDELAILVAMPTGDMAVQEIEEQLSAETFQEWRDSLTPTADAIAFPKLEMRTKVELIEPLMKLGIHSAFDDTADLSDISDVFLKVDAAVHQAWVKIDENGTEAAAATGIGASTTSEPIYIAVDRPFVFIVHDRNTGSILFVGRVMNPAE